jgi:hypothetical protein
VDGAKDLLFHSVAFGRQEVRETRIKLLVVGGDGVGAVVIKVDFHEVGVDPEDLLRGDEGLPVVGSVSEHFKGYLSEPGL